MNQISVDIPYNGSKLPLRADFRAIGAIERHFGSGLIATLRSLQEQKDQVRMTDIAFIFE